MPAHCGAGFASQPAITSVAGKDGDSATTIIHVTSPAELAEPEVSKFCVQAIAVSGDFTSYLGTPQLIDLGAENAVGPNSAAVLEYQYSGEAKRVQFMVAAVDASLSSCPTYSPFSSTTTYSAASTDAVTIGKQCWAALPAVSCAGRQPLSQHGACSRCLGSRASSGLSCGLNICHCDRTGTPLTPELAYWAPTIGSNSIWLDWGNRYPRDPPGVVYSLTLAGPSGATGLVGLTTTEHTFNTWAPGKYTLQLTAVVKNGAVYGASSTATFPAAGAYWVVGVPGPSQFVTEPVMVNGKLQLKWTPASPDPDDASTRWGRVLLLAG